jgi:hypothetical protein
VRRVKCAAQVTAGRGLPRPSEVLLALLLCPGLQMQSGGREAWRAARVLGAERPESRETGDSSPQIETFVDRSVTRRIAGLRRRLP